MDGTVSSNSLDEFVFNDHG